MSETGVPIDLDRPEPSPVLVRCARCGSVLAEVAPVVSVHTAPAYADGRCQGCGHEQRYGFQVPAQPPKRGEAWNPGKRRGRPRKRPTEVSP